MIGTIIHKAGMDAEAFREAMRFCCDPVNRARMLEYADRYEVAERPEEPARKSLTEPEPEPTLEERLAALEKRLDALEGGSRK